MQNNSEVANQDMPCLPNIDENNGLEAKSVIDLEKLYDKQFKMKPEIILAILEICFCGKGSCFSPFPPEEISFWDDMMENDIFQEIFNGYSGQTLRKFWMDIKNSNDIPKFIQLVVQNAVIIDLSNMDLGHIIEKINSFMKCDGEENFNLFFEKHMKGKKIKKKKTAVTKPVDYKFDFGAGGKQDNKLLCRKREHE